MKTLESGLVHIRNIKENDIEVLQKLTEADGHATLAPSYVVEKDQNMVGYIGVVPSVLVWMDTKRTKARDSMCVLNFFENMLACNGNGIIALPCTVNSPYRPYISRVGYTDVGDVKLFLKNLKA
jgi:hypothetical protein